MIKKLRALRESDGQAVKASNAEQETATFRFHDVNIKALVRDAKTCLSQPRRENHYFACNNVNVEARTV